MRNREPGWCFVAKPVGFTDLKTHKEQALKQLHLHSHVLTEVTENSKTSPKFRYRLRGVATKPNITYVLQHGTEAIARDEGWHESAQWWKIECRTQDTPYFEFLPERVTQTEVLRAAKSDSKDVLLIYANDVAIDEEVHGIPTSLEVSRPHSCQLILSNAKSRNSSGAITVPLGKR